MEQLFSKVFGALYRILRFIIFFFFLSFFLSGCAASSLNLYLYLWIFVFPPVSGHTVSTFLRQVKKKKKKCTHLILAVFISLLFRDCNYIIKKIILFTSDLFVYIRVFLQASSTENFTKTQIVPDSETTSRNLFTTVASYL